MTVIAAASVARFADAIGINTHIDWGGSPYYNAQATENALAYLGVGLVRDTIDSANDAAEFQQFNSDLGIKYDFYISPGNAGFNWQLQQIEGNSSIIDYAEGANESDHEPQSYDGLTGFPATKAEQLALYSAVHADAQLAGVKVIQTSFASVANFAVYGSQAGSADLANSHSYFGTGNNPGAGTQITTTLNYAQIVTPGAPNIATETGYYTMLGDPTGVSDIVQAKYDLDILFDDWKAGITASFLYELVDRELDPSNTAPDDHYGLFNYDWTPKPAAIALHNLMTLFGDAGTGGVATGSLDYTLSGMPSTANSSLFEKSNGTFVLAVWNDVRLSGPQVQGDIAVAPVAVTLTLTQPYQSITVYDPMTGTSAVQTFANAQTVQIMVPDHPVLIEIGNGPAAAAVTVGFPTVNAPTKILAATGGLVRVGGISVGNNPLWGLTVVVKALHGTLFMQDSNGRPLAGSGTSLITLRGSLAIVNTELATLGYTSSAAGGSDSISVMVTDTLGQIGNDAIPVVPIAVPAWKVSGAPFLSLANSATVATGGTIAIANAVLSDIYYAEHAGSLKLTVSVSAGTLQMTVAGVRETGTASITVTDSYAHLVADLATLAYVAGTATGVHTLTASASDPGGAAGSANMALDVVPALTVGGPATLKLVAQATGSLGTVRIVDAYGAGNADPLTVTISDAVGTLLMRNAYGHQLAGSGTNSITVTGTPDQINSELASLTYTTGSSLTTQNVTITATNAAGLSGSGHVAVVVVPALTLQAPSTLPMENFVIAPLRGVALTDSYGASGAVQMSATITDLYGALAMVNASGTALTGSGSHSMTISGSLATVNAELASLTYTGPSYVITDTVTITAADTGGGGATKTITLPVTALPLTAPYFQVADNAGHPFGRQPFLSSGSMALTTAATGLTAGISEQVSGGTVTLASQGWNLVKSVSITDTTGGSYALSNFVWTAATLSGGPTTAGQAETLTVNSSMAGSLILGTGNQNVVVNAGLGGASAGTNNLFSITEGSGTDSLTVNGYAGLTQAKVLAGSGTETMSFIGVGHVGVTGGSGHAIVHGGNAGNAIVAGSGTIDAWGGTAGDAYTYHSGAGVMIIENFATGDSVTIDKALQGSVSETVISSGVQLRFGGSAAHEILMTGLTAVPTTHIHWS